VVTSEFPDRLVTEWLDISMYFRWLDSH